MTTQKNLTLGEELKYRRESQNLSLRTVEEKVGISNAYLSQIENDKIKKPSANTLHKLSEVYNLDFNYLLSKAGILENQLEKENKSFGHFVFSKDNLTPEEEEELMQYLKFIRMKNSGK
jgi:HTH-type transcriptional regulator, competence development regulator